MHPSKLVDVTLGNHWSKHLKCSQIWFLELCSATVGWVFKFVCMLLKMCSECTWRATALMKRDFRVQNAPPPLLSYESPILWLALAVASKLVKAIELKKCDSDSWKAFACQYIGSQSVVD